MFQRGCRLLKWLSFSAQAHVFFPFSLSCLCSLFAELNGSPVTKKYKRTEKNELFPWKWIILWKVCKAYHGCALLFRVLHKDVSLNAKLLFDCVFFLLKSFYKSLSVRLFVRIDISPVSTTGTSDRNVLFSVVTHTRSFDPVAIIPAQTLSWRTCVCTRDSFLRAIVFETKESGRRAAHCVDLKDILLRVAQRASFICIYLTAVCFSSNSFEAPATSRCFTV